VKKYQNIFSRGAGQILGDLPVGLICRSEQKCFFWTGQAITFPALAAATWTRGTRPGTTEKVDSSLRGALATKQSSPRLRRWIASLRSQ
jgi:hypothetical protein